MSTAIRNFLIVFLLFLVIFGLVAWKVAVPYINESLLGEIDKGADNENSQLAEESENSGDIIETGKNRKLSVAFVGMANKEHVASIFFVRIDEEKGIYLTSSIPYDAPIANGGKAVPLYSYLYMRTPEDILNTVPYLVGYDIDYYAAFDYSGLYEVVKALGTVTVSLPTAIKVYNPDFMDEIQDYLAKDEPVPDAYCETYGPGDANISCEVLNMIWEYNPEGDETDYTIKNCLYESVFLAITKKTSLATNSEKYLEIMNSAISTTMGTEAFEEYGDLMFANGYLFKGNGSKRVLYNQTFSKMIVKIREAMGEY